MKCANFTSLALSTSDDVLRRSAAIAFGSNDTLGTTCKSMKRLHLGEQAGMSCTRSHHREDRPAWWHQCDVRRRVVGRPTMLPKQQAYGTASKKHSPTFVPRARPNCDGHWQRFAEKAPRMLIATARAGHVQAWCAGLSYGIAGRRIGAGNVIHFG
jgi:hypothetical protein